jgi:hypothetical protein
MSGIDALVWMCKWQHRARRSICEGFGGKGEESFE